VYFNPENICVLFHSPQHLLFLQAVLFRSGVRSAARVRFLHSAIGPSISATQLQFGV